MKTLKTLFIFMVLLSFSSCMSVPPKRKMEGSVFKDCTGSYIRKNNKDYLVCNAFALKNYKTGDFVKLIYQKSTYCPDLEKEVDCKMHHEFEFMINIKSFE